MANTKIKMPGWSLLALLFGLLPLVTVAAAGPTFNDPGFANTWKRVDKPLLDLPGGAGRGYTWGPAIAQASGVTSEPYNGGQRTVQYFDKARMEVNNPGGNPQDLFYVTTGLLVKELVTGKRQDGDNTFSQQQPSNVQVAGDTNEFGDNQIAPTYASFRFIGTFSGTENGRLSEMGQAINLRVTRDGQVNSFNPPEQRVIAGYDSVTQHNIPDVFVAFAGNEGPIWNGSANVNGKVLFDNPVYVLGRPLTEAYWTRAVVAGKEQDVMVQLYERRVLTYTPANAEGFKVEMGNVGQHYYRWRYSNPRLTVTKFWELGQDVNGMKEPSRLAVDAQGNSYVVTGFSNNIQKYNATGNLVKILSTTGNGVDKLAADNQGNLYLAQSQGKLVEKYDSNGNLIAKIGTKGIGEDEFGQLDALGLDAQNNLYVLDNSTNFIMKYDSAGKYLGKVGVAPALAGFNGSLGGQIAVDGHGNLFVGGGYIISKNTWKYVIAKFDGQGNLITLFNDPNINPRSFALDTRGNLFALNGPQVIKVDNTFKVLTNWGQDGPGTGEFKVTTAIGVDGQGNVYVADSELNRVQKFDTTGKFLSSFGGYAKGPGQLYHPEQVATDAQGNSYVADSTNAQVQKFDSQGNFLLRFGSYGSGNGQFKYPAGIAVDSRGNIFVADPVANTVQKFNKAGVFEWRKDNDAYNNLLSPIKLAVDGQDIVYVLTSSEPRIKKFTSGGDLLNGFGYSGSDFNSVLGFYVDRVAGFPGKVYVMDDLGNSTIRIRQFDSDGVFVGNLGNLPDSQGLNVPGAQALTIDSSGNAYVIDFQGRIREFGKDGKTVNNWGAETYSPVLHPDVRSMAFDNAGNLILSDYFNDRILKLGLS